MIVMERPKVRVDYIYNSPHVSQFVGDQCGVSDYREFGNHTSIGVARNGKAVAGVVYNWFQEEEFGNNIRVSIAGKSGVPWATREVLHELFEYPFGQLDCVRITAIIREGNKPSERFCKNLGFRKEGVSRRAWNGKTNALIYGMLKEECRYL
jgi:RimJ/RimL family protein N-acetyltransferase